MTTAEIDSAGPAVDTSQVLPAEALDALMTLVRSGGVELLGEQGIVAQLTKRILERALTEELTDHLGYERHAVAGRGSGNSRNGSTPKRVLTEIGAVELDVPRDRAGTFEPKIVPKGTTRLPKFNDNIVALYAQGLSTRDIRATMKRMYAVDISPDLVSRVTDGVVEELKEWQHRPLDAGQSLPNVANPWTKDQSPCLIPHRTSHRSPSSAGISS